MKLSEIVRVTEDQRLTARALRDYINQNPGATTYEVARYLGVADQRGVMNVSSRLHQMTKTREPVQKRQLDGKIRWYPYNYQLPVGNQKAQITGYRCLECDKDFKSALGLKRHKYIAHTEEGQANVKKMIAGRKTRGYNFKRHVRPSEASNPVPPPTDLEQLAKDYFWETGDTNLRTFIEWVRNK